MVALFWYASWMNDCAWAILLLLLAESHLTRRLFGAMVRGIAALPVASGETEAVAKRSKEARRRGKEKFAWKWLKKALVGFDVLRQGERWRLGGCEDGCRRKTNGEVACRPACAT